MSDLQFTREEDLPDPDAAQADVPDLSPLLGAWTNTNPRTRHIVKLVLREADGRFTVQAFGASGEAPCDWGEIAAEPFVTGVSEREGIGFHTQYDFGFMETKMVSNHSKGILVIQTYNSFKDGSGRANYFSREFFHR